MGVIQECSICQEQCGEFDNFEDEPVCDKCKNKALKLGISIIKQEKGARK